MTISKSSSAFARLTQSMDDGENMFTCAQLLGREGLCMDYMMGVDEWMDGRMDC